nr:disease resistance protein At4g27190-like [Ziziphus jujuba var. spinosa]
MSGTRIQSLPHSLLQLRELRALLLRDCFFLEELPPLGLLRRLQVLDLSATRIRELPEEMDNLINLRQLHLSSTGLKIIRAGNVSKWSSLEVLDMTLSNYQWGTEEDVEEGQATFEEIGCYNRIFLATRHDETKVTISGLNLSEEWIGWLLINASSLVIDSCEGLNKMLEHLAINSRGSFAGINSFESFVGLKSLTTTTSRSIFQPRKGHCTASYDLLPHLEEIHIYNLTYLESISELACHLGLQFSRLKLIEVQRCNNMRCLLSYGDLILTLPNLEAIEARSCYILESLFNYVSRQTTSTAPIVLNLKKLEMEDLPKLNTVFSRPEESCPRLKHVEVTKCYFLRKLPITIQNANVIKEIQGESHWRRELKWDNHETKSSVNQYFEAVRPKVQLPRCPRNTPVRSFMFET